MGDRFINTQNPKNEPPNIKTLDLRVQNSFDLRVGNRDFRQKLREKTKEFPPKIIVGRQSALFFFKWSTIGKS